MDALKDSVRTWPRGVVAQAGRLLGEHAVRVLFTISLAIRIVFVLGGGSPAIAGDHHASAGHASSDHPSSDHAAEIRKDGSCWPSRPGTDPRLCPPNDPDYAKDWDFSSDIPAPIDRKKMHPKELALGSIGFSLDTAWQHTIGRDDVVIAVLDSGILWDNKELVRKIYLNRGELPLPEGSTVYDKNGDGIF